MARCKSRKENLFEVGLVDDLQAAGWFVWTVRGVTLSQEQVAKVVEFWDRCVTWAHSQTALPAKLLATLGMLTWLLADAEGRKSNLVRLQRDGVSFTSSDF